MQQFYTPENFRAETCLGYLLRRVYKLSVVQVEAKLEDNGVGMTQWIVLSLVDRGIATTCRALSRNMGHDSGAMSRLVDQLETGGLLARVRDDADRRVSNLVVTDAGKAVLTRSAPPVIEVWNDILRDIAPEDIARTIGTLAKILGQLEEREAETAEA
jgi:DNA-binding MarR family transcriptional regulator